MSIFKRKKTITELARLTGFEDRIAVVLSNGTVLYISKEDAQRIADAVIVEAAIGYASEGFVYVDRPAPPVMIDKLLQVMKDHPDMSPEMKEVYLAQVIKLSEKTERKKSTDKELL